MKKLIITLGVFMLCVFMSNAQNIGWLKVDTETSSKGASLYVDGQYVSDVPATVTLTAGTHKIVVKKDLFLDKEQNVTVYANKIVKQTVNLVKNYSDVTIASPVSGALIYVDGSYVGNKESQTIPLLYGDHKVKVTHPKYNEYETELTVTCNTSSLNIPYLKPRVGNLVVNTNVEYATITANGVRVKSDTELKIGEYSIVVSKPGYTEYKQRVFIKEGLSTTVSACIEKLYDLNIESNIKSANVRINEQEYTYESYPRQVIAGEYKVSVEKEGYKTQTKKIKYPEQASVTHHYFNLPEYLFYNDDYFYIGLGAQAMRYAGIKLDMGGYISNVNIELNYVGGFRRRAVGSVGVYVDEGYDEPTYYEYNYKPKNYWGIMTGYGVKMGTRMRFTPQVGIGVMTYNSKTFRENFEDFLYEYSDDADKTGYEKFRTGALNFAAKFDIALVDGVALYFTPGYTYGFAGQQTVAWDVMTLNPDIRTKYAGGFNLSLGISFYF